MNLKYAYLVCILLFILGSCTTHKTDEIKETFTIQEPEFTFSDFDDLFKKITFDTLHLFPSKYDPDNLISDNNISSFLEYEADSGHYYPICKFSMSENITGYVVMFNGIFNNTVINLHLYNNSKQVFTTSFNVSSYIYLESAYEEFRNCWITDLNYDQQKDIVIYYELTDFEMPNEFADNISSSEFQIYYYANENYELGTWNSEMFHHFQPMRK